MVHREHLLQKGVVAFCRRCIAVPHEFASHDRAAPRSANDHIFQAARGLRRSWPDTELLLMGGRTFRAELKAPRSKVDEESHQAELLIRLNELGHQATWANSVTMYGRECERFGVPLAANWRTVAQLIDEHVLAAIRKEEAAAKKQKLANTGEAPPATLKLRTLRYGRPSPSQIRRGGMTVAKLP